MRWLYYFCNSIILMSKENSNIVSQQELDSCISILEKLVENNTQMFELPEEQRIALIKAAGKLSRPEILEVIMPWNAAVGDHLSWFQATRQIYDWGGDHFQCLQDAR